MGRPNKERAPLPPIWRLSDEQWAMVEPVLAEYDPPAHNGPERADWLSKCRGILIRWEKKAKNYLGLLQFACGLLWFRRYDRLTAT